MRRRGGDGDEDEGRRGKHEEEGRGGEERRGEERREREESNGKERRGEEEQMGNGLMFNMERSYSTCNVGCCWKSLVFHLQKCSKSLGYRSIFATRTNSADLDGRNLTTTFNEGESAGSTPCCDG